MFELFAILILVLVVRTAWHKTKTFYIKGKKHREIMKLFETEKLSFKAKRGLKRAFKKSNFKPNRWSKEQFGFLMYPKITRGTRIMQFSFGLMLFSMEKYLILLLPIIIGANLMFDWAVDIKQMGGCHRTIVRNSVGYLFAVAIDDVTEKINLIGSSDEGANWGNNYSTMNNGSTWNGAGAFTYTYHYVSITMSDNDKIHLISSRASGVHSFADIERGWCLDTSTNSPFLNWTTFTGEIATEGNAICGHVVTYSNNPYYIFSQVITTETSKYEIIFYYGSHIHVTSSSANDNKFPSLAVDSNGYFHTTWQNETSDITIKYGHTHDHTAASWKHSDDSTVITTGESGETIMSDASKDYESSSIAINFKLEKLDDIWVSAFENADDKVYAIQYDKSASAWQSKEAISGTDVVDNDGQLGIDAQGFIHTLWSIKTVGGIRHSEYDTSWSTPETLNS